MKVNRRVICNEGPAIIHYVCRCTLRRVRTFANAAGKLSRLCTRVRARSLARSCVYAAAECVPRVVGSQKVYN